MIFCAIKILNPQDTPPSNNSFKRMFEDGLPLPPYKVYNIGNSNPENLLDFVQILSEELVRAGVLPKDYDFESHKKLVAMQKVMYLLHTRTQAI